MCFRPSISAIIYILAKELSTYLSCDNHYLQLGRSVSNLLLYDRWREEVGNIRYPSPHNSNEVIGSDLRVYR